MKHYINIRTEEIAKKTKSLNIDFRGNDSLRDLIKSSPKRVIVRLTQSLRKSTYAESLAIRGSI